MKCKECGNRMPATNLTNWSDTFNEFTCVKCDDFYIYLLKPGDYKRARRLKQVNYAIESFKETFGNIKVFHVKKGNGKGIFIRGKADWSQLKMISLNVVIYDESNVIDRCILSARPYVDEIVLLIDRSCRFTDRLIMYADKFVIGNLDGSIVEHHRNRLIEASSHNWILVLDPDEFITPALGMALPKLVSQQDIDGWYLPRYNIVYDDNFELKVGDDFPDWNLRLLRSKGRYSGVIYEDQESLSTVEKPLGLYTTKHYEEHGLIVHDKTYEDIEEVREHSNYIRSGKGEEGLVPDQLKARIKNSAYYICSMTGNPGFSQCKVCDGDKYTISYGQLGEEITCHGYPNMHDPMAIRVPIYALEFASWQQLHKLTLRLSRIHE